MNALADRHPRLRHRIDHVDLALLPTPVRRLEHLGRALGCTALHLKDDGTGEVQPLDRE